MHDILKSETFQLQLLNGNGLIVYCACIEKCQANSRLGKVGEFRQVKLNFFLWKKVCEKVWTTTNSLTLISMRQGTFHPLSFLDQILNFQTVLEVKIDINRVNLTPWQGGAKNEHFSCFHSLCQLGLSWLWLQHDPY